jgi:chaperonin cofactor prefoldin
MSLLNPNVFFELGIRTALNKPVCMVKDQKTERVPFDTTIINHHTYNSTLAPWMLDEEIQSLKAHIEASMNSHGKNNALWSYFSMSMKAQPPKETTGVEGKVDFLNLQFEGLRRQLDKLSMRLSTPNEELQNNNQKVILHKLIKIAEDYGDEINSIEIDDDSCNFFLAKALPERIIKAMTHYTKLNGYKINFIMEQEKNAK